MRQHGYTKPRTWRKLHLSLDEKSRMIQAAILTEPNVHDADGGCELLNQTPGDIDQISGDGIYDKRIVYQAYA